jgi:hypothetical protein
MLVWAAGSNMQCCCSSWCDLQQHMYGAQAAKLLQTLPGNMMQLAALARRFRCHQQQQLHRRRTQSLAPDRCSSGSAAWLQGFWAMGRAWDTCCHAMGPSGWSSVPKPQRRGARGPERRGTWRQSWCIVWELCLVRGTCGRGAPAGQRHTTYYVSADVKIMLGCAADIVKCLLGCSNAVTAVRGHRLVPGR